MSFGASRFAASFDSLFVPLGGLLEGLSSPRSKDFLHDQTPLITNWKVVFHLFLGGSRESFFAWSAEALR
jgi:hypothetical protein